MVVLTMILGCSMFIPLLHYRQLRARFLDIGGMEKYYTIRAIILHFNISQPVFEHKKPPKAPGQLAV
jgi:hypothetical protein